MLISKYEKGRVPKKKGRGSAPPSRPRTDAANRSAHVRARAGRYGAAGVGCQLIYADSVSGNWKLVASNIRNAAPLGCETRLAAALITDIVWRPRGARSRYRRPTPPQ